MHSLGQILSYGSVYALRSVFDWYIFREPLGSILRSVMRLTMRYRRSSPTPRTTVTTRTGTESFARTLERQIEDIMSQAAPRRQTDGPERGVVSVLFVAIRGFVAMCEGIEPLDVGTVLNVYLETVADSTGKFLGTVQNSMGGLVMATWNAGYPQADHAVLAVNSAIDMVERIDDVNQRLRIRTLPEIRYGIGVNTGDALVAYAGQVRRQNDVVGDAVNVAQILAETAGGGEILAGLGTQVSIGDQVLMEDVGLIQAPGRRHPVSAFRVLGRP